ncbi:MAG TPA: peptidylprolyl isomerase [Candidatus Binatia bacterium]|nr:peptidylprolyl isomerase [Candidatus Binatia bacterium]
MASRRSRLLHAIALPSMLLVLAGAGCRKEEPQQTRPADAAEGKGEPVATYKGHTLTSDEVMAEFDRLPAPSRTYLAAPDRKRQFVENLVMNDLLFDEGQKLGYANDPEIDRQVNDLRKRLVVQRVMRQYQTPPTITDEQVRTYYDQNPSLYSTTQIHASHILVKDEELAKQIQAEVKATPAKFADVAREKSTDMISAKKGGDLGTFGAGRMVPEFEKVAFALKPGEVSDVVKTQYGYHIITVSERKEGELKPFEQVKEQIRATLRNRGLQEKVQGHFDQLKKDADLKIDDAALARVNPPPPAPGQPPQLPGGAAH